LTVDARERAAPQEIGETAVPLKSIAMLLGLLAGGLVSLGLLDGGGGALWPDVLKSFGVSKGAFGFLSGIGAVLALPILLFGARLTSRFDKRLLMAAASTLLALVSVGLSFGTGVVLFAVLVAVRAIAVTLLDLSTNAVVMDVEARTKRHLMSPLHAGYSGGAVAGAGLAWAAFSLGGGMRAVYLILTTLFLIYTVMILRERRDKPYVRQRMSVAGASMKAIGLLRRRDVRAFAILCAVSFSGEALISQWIGIYLRDERGYSPSTGAFAVIALGSTMVCGRVANGPLTVKAGPRAAMFFQGALTLAGGALMISTSSAVLIIAGCALAGLGLAGVAPTTLSLAGKAVPEASGAASGAALLGGYGGIAINPFFAGAVASTLSVRFVLAGVLVAGAVVLATAFRLNRIVH
jgi:predicted MFS family arabinose efflux permease